MIIFESVKSGRNRRITKWHLFWILFALNLIGFASAKFYFYEQDEQTKAGTEAVDFKNKYGASVHGASTLVNWGLEMLHVLRERK